MTQPQPEISDESAALLAAAAAPVGHDQLRRDVREALANPPDHSSLHAELGQTDRPSRRVA
ncbi:hypothetical protein [Cryptosporangium minutisporangium]